MFLSFINLCAGWDICFHYAVNGIGYYLIENVDGRLTKWLRYFLRVPTFLESRYPVWLSLGSSLVPTPVFVGAFDLLFFLLSLVLNTKNFNYSQVWLFSNMVPHHIISLQACIVVRSPRSRASHLSVHASLPFDVMDWKVMQYEPWFFNWKMVMIVVPTSQGYRG